ncbi:hypothetical protein DPMN_191883 [Dreissena polymorpha]|uniref:Uncharacterized protein n=1 Tax=Dreissena polymorpha TaxID=45954 RepID=A0A9D4BC11_DREPO|nr:hypothetical protein DPMN_191883 [Dreissena polymorpha]
MGSNAGIAPVGAGGVTVFRGSAVTLSWLYRDVARFHWGSTGAYPATTGMNRSQSGVDRDSAGLLTGFNRGGTGK